MPKKEDPGPTPGPGRRCGTGLSGGTKGGPQRKEDAEGYAKGETMEDRTRTQAKILKVDIFVIS